MDTGERPAREEVASKPVDDQNRQNPEYGNRKSVKPCDADQQELTADEDRESHDREEDDFERAGGHAGVSPAAASNPWSSNGVPMVMVLGAHSPKLELVRALRTKAGRREQGRFAVDGTTMLAEALACGRVPEEIYATEAALATFDTRDARLDGRIFTVPEKALAKLSELETPPGLLAIFRTPVATLETLLSSGRPAIALAGVADPGNAGTLLRSAEIFGIESAIFVRDAVEAYNPKLVRATMGAIFRMSVATVDGVELEAGASLHGYRIVASATGGSPLSAFRFVRRSILAIGNERHGVASWLPHVDDTIAIPQIGQGESLNASVAGAIIFYTFSQQFGHDNQGS